MRDRRLPRFLSLLLLPVLVAGVAACAGGEDEELTVYSGRNEKLIGPLLARFTEETGIKVNTKYGDSAELALTIEREADRSPAQVYIAQNPGAMGYVANLNRLATLPEQSLQRVSEERRSDTGTWVGLTARVRVLVVNTDKVSDGELPQSVNDLTGPAWKGRVAMAPTNGSFQDFVSAMRQTEGDEATEAFLTGLKANDARPYGDNNAIVEAVSRGEVDSGLVNHYYVSRFLSEDPSLPIKAYFFTDDPGSVALVSTVGVLSGAAENENARRLVDFLLSAESQQYFSDETREYALAEGAADPEGSPPLSSLRLQSVDLEELGDYLGTTLEMIRRSGLAE